MYLHLAAVVSRTVWWIAAWACSCYSDTAPILQVPPLPQNFANSLKTQKFNPLHPGLFNSSAPGRCCSNFKSLIWKQLLRITLMSNSSKMPLRWMPETLLYDKSTLVQVMAWCRQATSHYLSQCWPRSLSPYGVTRPQWVKKIKIIHLLLYHSSTDEIMLIT